MIIKRLFQTRAENSPVRFDVRLDGDELGTVNIDPIVYGAAYVIKF